MSTPDETPITTEHSPTCPHCGWVDEDTSDALCLKSDGDEWNDRCPSCLRYYHVKMNVRVSFETSVTGDE